MDPAFGDRRLELTYPCRWSYTLIGNDEGRMRTAVAHLVADAPHTVEFSNHSRTGKYCSLAVEVTVRDEAHRLGLFQAFSKHAEIRFVI
jgi:uncharacterized protein